MRGKMLVCLFTLLLIFLAAGRAEAMDLTVGGKTVSTSVKVTGGTAYATLRDLLNALGDWEFTWDGSIRTAKAQG